MSESFEHREVDARECVYDFTEGRLEAGRTAALHNQDPDGDGAR
jgi:hypothetical protein